MSKPILIDGLIFRCTGWSSPLERSRLSAFHVTVADPFASFAGVCDEIAKWHALFQDRSDRFFHLNGAPSLDLLSSDDRVGVIMGLQNCACLADKVERVAVLSKLGVRVLQPTYNHATLFADGCLEDRNAGLSALGRRFIRECNAHGVLIDVSHLGERSALDAIDISDAPVAATHANLFSIVPNPRNKPDQVAMAIAASGGVIGISPWGPMCWDGSPSFPTVDAFLRQIFGALDLVGDDAVAIGTDLPAVEGEDPFVTTVVARSLEKFPEIFASYAKAFGNSVDTRYCEGFKTIESWPSVSELLSASGLGAEVVEKIMGRNWLRLYRDVWATQEVAPLASDRGGDQRATRPQRV